MSEHLTRGVACAVLTPVDSRDAVCMDLLIAQCRWLLDAGCSSIVLLGTTGEANSFSADERRAILEGVVAGGIAPASLIVGTGCCAIRDSASLTAHALALGVARVLVLPPFYYKGVDDGGVVAAYARTIDAVGDDRLRVYLYQIPQLTGVPIGTGIIEELLARYPSVLAGIKDSSGDWDGISQLCSRFSTKFDVLVGSERFLLAGLRAGASGCVTATANANAAMICELYERRDEPAAEALQVKVAAARSVFEAHPMIAALKEAAARRTGDLRWRHVRPPLTMLAPARAKTLP